MRRRRRRRTAFEAAATVAAATCAPALAAWLVGQAFADRFAWSQFVFWVPAFAVSAVAAACVVAALAMGGGRGVRRAAVAVSAIALAFACARSARWEFGWRPWARAAVPGEVVVTHWNPQWPGRDAFELGRALAPHAGDVCVISNPGSVARGIVAAAWVPPGSNVADRGQFAIVSRHPIAECSLLAVEQVEGVGLVWVGWAVIEVDGFGPLRVLAVDLPSNPRMPRSASAAALESVLGRVLGDRVPDVVVGDVNATPGGVVHGALGRFGRAAPPWASFGWLCTFRRPWPTLRIEAMLAADGVGWCGYRTIDLGAGEHRAQQGVLARAVSASMNR
jgi:hypothetical protein